MAASRPAAQRSSAHYVRAQLLTDPAIRRHVGRSAASALRGRTDHQDLAGPQGPGRSAERGRHDRARPAAASVRRDVVLQPGTGEVLAMAINRVYGDTTDHLPVYGTVNGKHVESEDRIHTKFNYATAPGFPGRLDLQDVHAGCRAEQGLSTATTFKSPACIYLASFPYGIH